MPFLTLSWSLLSLYHSPVMWVIVGLPMVQGWTISLRDDSPVLVAWQARVSQLNPGPPRPAHGVFPCLPKWLWYMAMLVTDTRTPL